MTEVKDKPAKKATGNRTTELVIGTAAQKFESAVKTLMTIAPEVSKLTEIIGTSTLKVTDLEDKIGGLKQDFENKTAQNKIEIQQAFETNRREFVDKWLKDNGFMTITPDELQKLKMDLAYATDKVDEQVNKAVGAVTGNLKQSHINEIKIKDLEHEKKEASNTAELVQLKNQNKFLEDQLSHWKNMLTAQMSAETERSKHSAVGTINVGDNNKR